MKNKNILFYQILLFYKIIRECFSYNESVPFNWTKTPQYCYVEDFILSNNYRTLLPEIFPIRGCSSDERNQNYFLNEGITNITFQPKLDFFFPKEEFPPINTDPPTYMTFRISFKCYIWSEILANKYKMVIHFGRSEDYLPIPKISKRTGKPIEFIGNKAILSAKYKYKLFERQVYFMKGKLENNFTSQDFDFYDYEGEELNVTFNGYDLHINISQNPPKNLSICDDLRTRYGFLIRVYDLPRMKVQGLFQYNLSIYELPSNSYFDSVIYTVDTRNVFFQNISMFYNQRVNVTKMGNEPTGEDSGFWINTPCNTPQMATIMVDYFFFDTIHRMQNFGYEFNDRFQLRIHTPYYRNTVNRKFSLFRSQWNETYEKPRVFIHPIYKYKEYCLANRNECVKSGRFNYEEWSTNPKFTKYIIDIKNEITENVIKINFSELEKIYEADGYNRSKLVININNTMTPHITQITNGLWAELVDTVTNDWVMKTKTTMDEVHGYTDDNEPDPFRNFYLTCEIPDNITKDDMEFMVKKYGILQTAHIWFRLDVFNKGITKMYPPRFNVVFRFPPEIMVTNKTFGYTYQYYRIPGDIKTNWYWIAKDFRKTGYDDGAYSNTTFDYKRNMVNVSELHPNYPNGDDTLFYTQTYDYYCYYYYYENTTCFKLEVKRQFLYYFFDLSIAFSKNGTRPVDITVYHVKYVPYHAKDQINRGLHRWNPHHAGWDVNDKVYFYDKRFKQYYYAYYFESYMDNFYLKAENSDAYYNMRGSTSVEPYSGGDCIFGFAGGSTMRNRTCEYFNGLIPDKPFTNYARDIFEEHIAYRTLNDDDTFTIDTRTDVRANFTRLGILDPYPGKFTAICFEVLYWTYIERVLQDGEPTCPEFYEKQEICGNHEECYKPIYNVHEYPKEFFVKIALPEGITVNASCIGKVLPCYWAHRGYFRFTYYSLQDYLCYYVNNTHIYAFNSIGQLGFCPNSGDFDIIIQVDGVYIHEDIWTIKKGSGLIKFGFYESTFFIAEYPRNPKDDPLILIRNVTIDLSRSNVTNDGIGNFTLNITAKHWFNKDTTFRFDFDRKINHMKPSSIAFNGNSSYYSFIKLKAAGGIIEYAYLFDYFCPFMNLPFSYEVGPSLHVTPYLLYHNDHEFPWNFSFINESETMVFEINVTVENYRSFKPMKLDFYMTNFTFKTVFQHEVYEFANTKPQYLYNLTVTPNSYYTSDRAIYTINYISYMNGTFKGDVFEFKTSWRSSYRNNKDPDEEGYFINRITFDRYYSRKETLNLTLYGNPIVNPDSLEVQYIKDIKILDEEGYLVAVCPDIIPIQMKKFIGFKHTEVNTVRTINDSTKFDISFEIVPEVLIKKNDTLKMKFSSGVLLKNYSECKINSEKGLNVSHKAFICEININNNELIIYNGFHEIGETEFIFDDRSSNALVDQEFIFTLKDIPMNRTHDNEEIFSIEIKTESGGIITQKNNLPSTAYFECGYRCKTCEKENINLCLSCVNEYPIYYKNIKECHKLCPSEKYYIKINEEGNKECALCDEPCKSCFGISTNCTECIEPYFLENNKCVLNCSINYSPDYIIRKCYPITYINDTRFIEKIVYINISVPVPYPVYIDRNVCIIPEENIVDDSYEESEEELNSDFLFEELEIENIEFEKKNEKEFNEIEEYLEEKYKENENILEEFEEKIEEIMDEKEKEIEVNEAMEIIENKEDKKPEEKEEEENEIENENEKEDKVLIEDGKEEKEINDKEIENEKEKDEKNDSIYKEKEEEIEGLKEIEVLKEEKEEEIKEKEELNLEKEQEGIIKEKEKEEIIKGTEVLTQAIEDIPKEKEEKEIIEEKEEVFNNKDKKEEESIIEKEDIFKEEIKEIEKEKDIIKEKEELIIDDKNKKEEEKEIIEEKNEIIEKLIEKEKESEEKIENDNIIISDINSKEIEEKIKEKEKDLIEEIKEKEKEKKGDIEIKEKEKEEDKNEEKEIIKENKEKETEKENKIEITNKSEKEKEEEEKIVIQEKEKEKEEEKKIIIHEKEKEVEEEKIINQEKEKEKEEEIIIQEKEKEIEKEEKIIIHEKEKEKEEKEKIIIQEKEKEKEEEKKIIIQEKEKEEEEKIIIQEKEKEKEEKEKIIIQEKEKEAEEEKKIIIQEKEKEKIIIHEKEKEVEEEKKIIIYEKEKEVEEEEKIIIQEKEKEVEEEKIIERQNISEEEDKLKEEITNKKEEELENINNKEKEIQINKEKEEKELEKEGQIFKEKEKEIEKPIEEKEKEYILHENDSKLDELEKIGEKEEEINNNKHYNETDEESEKDDINEIIKEEEEDDKKPKESTIKEQNIFRLYNTTILPHKFKYKKPFDYYLLPIFTLIGLILCECLFCCKIINLFFYILCYLIIGLAFKIDLILVFIFSFWTGYEPFFYLTAIIFMIHMYLTTTFVLFNICSKKSKINLKTKNKIAWLLSLLGTIITDYKCLELFTRTKIKYIKDSKSNPPIKKSKKQKKEESSNQIQSIVNYDNSLSNMDTNNNINNLNLTSNENELNYATKKIQQKKITKKKIANQNSLDNKNNSIENNNLNNYYIDLNKKDNNIKETNNIKKYILIQEICLNKLIILLDFILVYLFFTIICIYIGIKYKTYSFLWFAAIYGIIFAILNIIFFIRFTYIQPYEYTEVEEKHLNKIYNKLDIIKSKDYEEKIVETETDYIKTNELSLNKIPEKKIFTKDSIDRKFSSSFGKYKNKEKEIKEAPSEEEESKKERIKAAKDINDDKISNIFKKRVDNLNKNPEINNVKKKNIFIDSPIQKDKVFEFDDEVINNPYREDLIINTELESNKNTFISKIFGKNEKNIKSEQKENIMKQKNIIPESSIKNKTNDTNIQNKETEEKRRLNSYINIGSDEFRPKSTDSINTMNSLDKKIIDKNINNMNDIRNINNRYIYSVSNIKKENIDNKVKEEEDISSVIYNPLRDDIDH